MTALPSGLVTFMFTDIEGSTRLHHALGSRYVALIAEHDGLLREQVSEFGGAVVNSVGDGLFVVFADAASALRAAEAIQDVVAAHTWPNLARVRVRIGLHTGEAEPFGQDYIAIAVHQAARVSAAASGGQTLATSDVVAAAGGNIASGLRSHGKYRLKDFDEPIELISVGAADPERDPAPRATSAAAHNVPVVRTSFVGRTSELADLAALVTSDARLVSVLGPGGVGKTRLALEVVKSVAPSYPEGAWVVLLANASTTQDVDDRLIRTLRIPERANTPLRRTLLTALAERDTLLLLDNTEHVTDAVAGLVRQMLDECPRLTLLVTSRQPLGLAGEVEWRLPPMSLTADNGRIAGSVELFVERAVARNPKLNFDAAALRTIEEICRQVDGLPLGIELAAGRLRHMTLGDLAARLHERLRVTVLADRELDERQRTLDDLVDWSYQLLSDVAQTMLRRMSVLQGSASLEAIEALAAKSADVPGGLAELIDKSLVSFDDDAEWPYRMLVTIRRFAQQQLGSGEEAVEARRCHARYYRDLARQIRSGLVGADPDHWLGISDRAHDDVSAAMRFAETDGDGDTLGELANLLAICLFERGQLTEACAWLSRAERVSSLPSIRAQVLGYGGFLLAVQGDTEQGKRWCERGVNLAISTQDDDLLAETRLKFAQVLGLFSGDLATAKGQLQSALSLSATPQIRARLVLECGIVAHLEGKFDEAIDYYRRAHDAFLSAGYVLGVPNALSNLGEALVHAGRLKEAEKILTEALESTSSTRRTAITHNYVYLGKLCQARGDASGAAGWAAKAHAMARHDGNVWAIQEIQTSGLLGVTSDGGRVG